MTVYGYARVSTAGQSLVEQKNNLKEYGAEIIISEKYTGTTTDRPQFDKLVRSIKGNDTLIVTKLDRFARNTREALNLIDSLLQMKVIIKVINLGTIDNTPLGRLIVRTLLSVAEMERDLIIERTRAGKMFAKQHNPNYKEGRPKRKKDSRNQAIFEYSKSHTISNTAETFDISTRTVSYVKALFKWTYQVQFVLYWIYNKRKEKSMVDNNWHTLSSASRLLGKGNTYVSLWLRRHDIPDEMVMSSQGKVYLISQDGMEYIRNNTKKEGVLMASSCQWGSVAKTRL